MNFSDRLRAAQKEVITFLDEYRTKQENYTKLNRWGEDALQRLFHFIKRGKMLRGMIILSMRDFFGFDSSNFVRAATAIEFMHCTYLIQDDIMDDDRLRRSEKSMFAQYEAVADQEHIKEDYLFGISLAICVSDISLFFYNDLIHTLDLDDGQKDHLREILTSKSIGTGLGQMQDVYFGFSNSIPSQEEVLAMYDAKTARYTFSLPLMIGALLAGAQKPVIAALDTIGSLIGMIFQIKDDELRLIGGDEIGKPLGSDILLRKKTPHYCLLLQKASEGELKELEHIQEQDNISSEGLAFVTSLLDKHAIISQVSSQVDALAAEAREKIAQLEAPVALQAFLVELLEFNLSRKT